ncbi:lumazine synthase [Perkinsus olseni]|uniref:6,7-dimethyl-8-ribityllumazine synthase n=1 Tax=Perkinsus olseni TaxID=32597 RepID=A0A7J6NWQ4_PEROL|nr:lumazine synthase [Perkinsus olseni]
MRFLSLCSCCWRKTEVDAVIALGCLIKGETMHFEYISEAVTHGLMRLGLDYKKPVIYGVLTVMNEEQAKARCGLLGDSVHHNEAREWAKTAIRQCNIAQKYKC